ncbi:hypothetical protein [Parasitella parasitica]|uniref:Uncharacterized protein n=1 Tax=Parasitella parasitica TaxID=35722 RepID=A0A0B7NDS5_9FUNG|nr:hypothetical protein [Parasitella parasitica]
MFNGNLKNEMEGSIDDKWNIEFHKDEPQPSGGSIMQRTLEERRKRMRRPKVVIRIRDRSKRGGKKIRREEKSQDICHVEVSDDEDYGPDLTEKDILELDRMTEEKLFRIEWENADLYS